jgi:hypothetical protein
MSRWHVSLIGLILVLAACTSSADDPVVTTAPAPATTSAPESTSPETTGAPDASTTTTTTEAATTTTAAGPVVSAVEITVTEGSVDRVERFDIPLDGTVRIVVSADVSDEIHVHGYDLHADVAPGQEAVVEFEATIPGIFEIELEGLGVLIGELAVAP